LIASIVFLFGTRGSNGSVRGHPHHQKSKCVRDSESDGSEDSLGFLLDPLVASSSHELYCCQDVSTTDELCAVIRAHIAFDPRPH
jgi:hypothetical protein